jgi:molybdopterin-guanine dinucleotide biosynthesis protein A
LFAADLPFLDGEAVAQLRASVVENRGAYFTDAHGRPQWLCSVWPDTLLRRRVRELKEINGAPLRQLLQELPATAVVSRVVPPPWYDCDTEEQLARARQWAKELSR